jgi:hypothetical protein
VPTLQELLDALQKGKGPARRISTNADGSVEVEFRSADEILQLEGVLRSDAATAAGSAPKKFLRPSVGKGLGGL